MTASPGREVDANLLRGAAPGSTQARAEPPDSDGQDFGDLVERSPGVMRSGWRALGIRVPRFMIVALWPAQPEPAAEAVAGSPDMYTTPYLDLMRRAIVALPISESSQPKKETVMAWFREQTIDHQPISENFSRHLATFVRLPESQRGGNRKWRFDEEDRADHVGP
jgi:hypothetical protein